jgi:hypothetical protein
MIGYIEQHVLLRKWKLYITIYDATYRIHIVAKYLFGRRNKFILEVGQNVYISAAKFFLLADKNSGTNIADEFFNYMEKFKYFSNLSSKSD